MGYLSDNKENMLTGFFLEAEVDAGTVNRSGGCDMVGRTFGLDKENFTPSTEKFHEDSFLTADIKKIR